MAAGQLLRGQSGLPVDNSTKSYWHKEPSGKLLGHRTTKELPRSADVVIVGSGITGSFAAHFLKEKKPDLNVVMLEAREACWGATGRNGGHCQPAIYAASKPHIASFELRNFLYLKSLVEEYSIPCDWRSTSGVHAFYSAELFSIAQKIVANLSDNYPDLAANVAVVTKGEKGKAEGELSGTPAYLLEGERRELTLHGLRVPNAEGAVVQWNAASLWPYKLVSFVLERLLAANNEESSKGSFNLQTNTPVTGLTRAELSNIGHNSSSKPQSIWTIHTPRGTILSPQILLATNGYTSHLLPSLSDLIIPTRGQVSSLTPPEQPSVPTDHPLDIGHTYYIVGEPNAAFSRDDYLIQRPPPSASLIFGGGRQHARKRGVGVWDDSSVDESVSWYLRGELGSVVDLSLYHEKEGDTETKKQDLTPTHEWTGIMGYTRDGHPFVGSVPEGLGGGSGLYVCAGYTGHGMPNAVLSARAVVDILLSDDGKGGEVEVDLPPEYELTEDRVLAARLLDEVAVVDEKGSLYMDFGAVRG
ncbi:FAD dependent oxidoreductase [Hypoxylon trugodes]|uniref:FAD dependent oxidoreductase n=1 Tax=Hypoxylon trugodes TaxID=326681 RepID=UPI00219DE981|nr:FAD dependent oxidoreductase [Hypoxylon trugodes]KAI1390002.1 FAD dependent oxidoreductase [Hypoxylon trugodes]